jgi:trk system potassium uptake protein TrkA
MKIIILGAGQVGATVAENLVSEENDITIVDADLRRLQELQDRIDLNTVVGQAAHPGVLREAGADDADMVLAVTNSDETNMVACQIAYSLFHVPTKIARIRAPEYLAFPKLFSQESVPIDVLISPEQAMTDYLCRLIEHPDALQVLDFADGKVQMVNVKALPGGTMIGHQVRTLREHMPHIDARLVAIFRNGKPIIPIGDTVIEPDDEVLFAAAKKNIRTVMREMRKLDKQVRRVIIGGGGNVGKHLAAALEDDYQVKIIEQDPERTRVLSEQLDKAIVLLGNAADEGLLLQENIENTDAFCAVTNDEEANILSAMLAKRLGARKVMALINRTAYVDLVESSSIIDIAISPQQITIGRLLAHVRRGDTVVVHSLRRGAAEAIEIIAHGDTRTSKVVGRQVCDISLPPNTAIAALVRGDEVLMPHHDTMIESEDHVIVFLADKKHIPQVEQLFQVGITFL